MRRTEAQNRLLWVVYRLAAALPASKGKKPLDIHDSMGLKFRLSQDHTGMPIVRSTTDYDLEEMSIYIDKVRKYFNLEEPR